MNPRTVLRRFRSLLIAGAIFVAGGCCGMSLVIIVSSPTRTPTPTAIPQRIVTVTQTATSTATATLTATIPTITATPTASNTPSDTSSPSYTPTRQRPTALPTNTKRAPPATNTPRGTVVSETEVSKTEVTKTDIQIPQLTGTTTFDPATYEAAIKIALSVYASKRDIVSVKIEDGRPNGGERVVIVTYRTIETDLEARAKELLDIYVVVGGSIQAYAQDVDSVKLILADKNDNTIAVSTVSKQNLLDYQNGTISMQQLIDRIKVENLSKSP